MNNSQSLLFTDSISKSFNGVKVIDDVCINLNEGETVSVLGISGSGKTTLFNIISGIMTPDSGKVYFNGEDITSCPGKISYMLQKDLLFEHKKIIDNVSMPLVLRGLSKREARKKAMEYFLEFGLENTQNLYPSSLSGGMRQRAAFLRTYLSGGKVVLLDEPFSALDTITKSLMHKWYLETSEKLGLSTFFITHDIDEALFISDRVYIMSGSPALISHEFVIDVDRRERKHFNLTGKFIEYKKMILDCLD